MILENIVESLQDTPYSIESRIENQLTLERILEKLEELRERYIRIRESVSTLLRSDPDFRAYQTFHSNKLELQGPDLETTYELISEFTKSGEPDDLRLFSAIQSVVSDQHLVEVLGQHQANILVERIALEFTDERPFGETDLRALNSFCIQDNMLAGTYRTSDRLNLGQNFEDGDPFWFSRELDHPVEVRWQDVPDHLRQICNYISARHECAPLAAAVAHTWFTHVHPFHDGNGRTARLLANLVLIRNNWPPITISKGKRDEYLDALTESDKGGDIRLLFELFTDCLDMNLSDLEDPEFWGRRYKSELQQNLQQRVSDWTICAREFVDSLRGYLRQRGWVLERVSMPDNATFLLLEESQRRASTLFGKLRHPDGREIRIVLSFMTSLFKQSRDFNSTIDGQHYPPTLYFIERDYDPNSAFPFVQREKSKLKVREFTFYPGAEKSTLFRFGTHDPMVLKASIDELSQQICSDLDALSPPVRVSEAANEVEPNPAVSDSRVTIGNFEIARAITVLEQEVQRHSVATWQDVMDLLLTSVLAGNCLQQSLEINGVLGSTIGEIVRSVGEKIPDLSNEPLKSKDERKGTGFKMIDLLVSALDRAQTDRLVIVASNHEKPHPTLVDSSRKYGRKLWN
jgi:Fic family protein